MTITLRVLGLTLLTLTVDAPSATEAPEPERATDFAFPVGFYVPDLPDRYGDYYED